MERRRQVPDRRKGQDPRAPAERRSKSRRKNRNFQGSPPTGAITIDMADDDIVVYWATELEITADELKAAVQNVGPSVKAVREHLGK